MVVFHRKKFHRNWFMLLFFQSIVVLILYYSYYWLVFQIHLRSKVPWVPTVFFPARRSYLREKSKAPRQLFIRKVLDINSYLFIIRVSFQFLKKYYLYSGVLIQDLIFSWANVFLSQDISTQERRTAEYCIYTTVWFRPLLALAGNIVVRIKIMN